MSGSFDRVMEERKKLVDQIIENMKQGYIVPEPQWGVSPFTFHNPVSGARYHGANMIKLYLYSAKFGYTDTRFMTYKQAQSKGWQIRKGEKGIRLEKFIFNKQVEQENPDTGQMEKITVRLQRPMVNTFVVFNACQIEGIEPMEEMKPLERNEVLDLADQLIASSECPVKEEPQGKAYYSPKRDLIVLPPRDVFINQEAFATTLMHEMVHSTGHQSRLNRSILNKFGTPEYALEELRAELGAFFMGTDLGIEGSQKLLDSHTDYLKSWISVLENDPNELFRACSDAQKAVERLSNNLEKYQELCQKKEAEIQAAQWDSFLGNDDWIPMKHPRQLSSEYFDNQDIQEVILYYQLDEKARQEIITNPSYMEKMQYGMPDRFYLGKVNGHNELILGEEVFDHELYHFSKDATRLYELSGSTLKEIADSIYDYDDVVALTVDEHHLNHEARQGIQETESLYDAAIEEALVAADVPEPEFEMEM